MKRYAALFVREDSAYKQRESCDAYDINRDALNYHGNLPVVCHNDRYNIENNNRETK